MSLLGNWLNSAFGTTIVGTFGSDNISGSAGKDTIVGLWGKDWIYGDGAPQTGTATVDFGNDATWSALSVDKTSFALVGMDVTATGGVFDHFMFGQVNALGILSPNDDPTKIYAHEIDTFVDAAEHVTMNFELAQSAVTVTLQQMYKGIFLSWTPTPEKVVATIQFTDGSSAQTTVLATGTTQPGEVQLTLKSEDFGGRMIAAIDLTASTELPPQRADLPQQYKDSYQASHPYSTFVLKGVSYLADPTASAGGDDKLFGGFGNDKLWGGAGDDRLAGGWGNDLLVGGSGDNTLWGGWGCDTFAFGWQSKGCDVIKDFEKGYDKIRLMDGITITGMDYTKTAGTTLHLSSGGEVLLAGVKISDWHTII